MNDPTLHRAGSAETRTPARRLVAGDEPEVLDFLSARPVHTVIMAGMIRDNGLEGPENRGHFYGCRADDGRLTGVAHVGHLTLFETGCDAALDTFADLARRAERTRVVAGEPEKLARFWPRFLGGAEIPHRLCRELLFELRGPSAPSGEEPPLRRATAADAEAVVEVHARMALEESGIDPLKADGDGFRRRAMRRIERGRVWVWVDSGRLIFKADVVADTPGAAYLEGLYVDPAERGKGHGLRCLSRLSRALLEHSDSICLLVNVDNSPARSLYRRAGYELRGRYDMIFIDPRAAGGGRPAEPPAVCGEPGGTL